jgi:hypothetical protein
MDRKPDSDHEVRTDIASGPTPVPPARAQAVHDFSDVPRVSGDLSSHSQRESPRRTLPCNVLVNTGSAYLIAHAIHDISLVGVFVELDSTGLVLGDLVDVVLEFSDPPRTVDLQLSAEVVRIERAGVGLRFCDYSDQTYTDLVNLLYTR